MDLADAKTKTQFRMKRVETIEVPLGRCGFYLTEAETFGRAKRRIKYRNVVEPRVLKKKC